MSYPINYPTPQGANVQIFYQSGDDNQLNYRHHQTWIKPRGASFVWFTLIGGGGGGGTAVSDGVAGSTARGGGGGSGGIYNLLLPAFLIPDSLMIKVGRGGLPSGGPGRNTSVSYKSVSATIIQLAQAVGGSAGGNASASGGVANNGSGGSAGNTLDENEFKYLGIVDPHGGDAGSAGNANKTTSTQTVLQGGPGGDGSSAASPFGYEKTSYSTASVNGFGVFQPIINSLCANQAGTVGGAIAGFGSGGGGATSTTTTLENGNAGGDGVAIIISW